MYYITGISGSGKSTIQKELISRGFVAYDGDSHGITRWQKKHDGEFLDNDKNIDNPSPEFLEEYEWAMQKDVLKEIATDHDEPIFICGNASNRYDLWHLFEKVFSLRVDQEELIKRLKTRKGNNFGKHPEVLKQILAWHKQSEASDKKAGAIIIDANKPLNKVVDQILESLDIIKT